MGIATGRFVIDTHVHAQRHAFKFKQRGIKPDYAALAGGMGTDDEVEVYDNTPRLLYDMERYGVDMCVIMPAYGMTDEINAEIVKKYPDKFVSMCSGTAYQKRIRSGEAKYSIKDLCKYLDELLSTGLYRGGIGEAMPGDPMRTKPLPWEERFEEICQIMEVARKHKVPACYHTGEGTIGYRGGRRAIGLAFGEGSNPLLAHDVAAAYPDVTLILQHGGMGGWWSEMHMEPCFQVAASHPNVYLETGLYWAELYERPLRDPNIGCEKLIWGTDWGASIPQQWQPGGYPEVYASQSRKDGPPAHQVDYWGWQLRELDKLEIPQDDLNLILGGNAVRIFHLEDKVPYTRLFKQYLL